jgi:hypothetical protein
MPSKPHYEPRPNAVQPGRGGGGYVLAAPACPRWQRGHAVVPLALGTAAQRRGRVGSPADVPGSWCAMQYTSPRPIASSSAAMQMPFKPAAWRKPRPTPLGGSVVERKAKRGRTLGRLVPQEGLELDTAVSGSAGKRRRDDDDRNDRNSKRSAVMRVCMAGEGSGSDLGAGGSGNGAGSGEMEYDGREAGIGASAGMESDMGRSGQIGGGGKRGVLM